MSEFPRPNPDALTTEQQALWRYIVEGPRGKNMSKPVRSLPGPFGPWLQIPSFGQIGAEMGERLRLAGLLPGPLRELAILATGAHWRAEFEFWAHAREARREGLPDSIIEALRTGEVPPYQDKVQKLVHEGVKSLLAEGAIRSALRDDLVEALGWPSVVELVSLVGFYCLVSFTLSSFDVGLPAGESPVWR